MLSNRAVLLLVFSAGCAARQAGPTASAPYDLKLRVVGEGLAVSVDSMRLPWNVTRGKGGTHAFLEFQLKDSPAALTLMVAPDERLQPALTIFMVQATLLQNGLTVSKIQSMNSVNTDLRITFSGVSKEVGKGGGQVRSWTVLGSGKTVVLMGMWPEALNASANADFETLVRGIKAAKTAETE